MLFITVVRGRFFKLIVMLHSISFKAGRYSKSRLASIKMLYLLNVTPFHLCSLPAQKILNFMFYLHNLYSEDKIFVCH